MVMEFTVKLGVSGPWAVCVAPFIFFKTLLSVRKGQQHPTLSNSRFLSQRPCFPCGRMVGSQATTKSHVRWCLFRKSSS